MSKESIWLVTRLERESGRNIVTVIGWCRTEELAVGEAAVRLYRATKDGSAYEYDGELFPAFGFIRLGNAEITITEVSIEWTRPNKGDVALGKLMDRNAGVADLNEK